MFKKLIFIILLLSINYVKGSEFDIKIAYYPKEVIKGEPCNVTVMIKNISGKEILVAGGFNGLNKEFIVRRADGKARKEIIPPLRRIFAKEVEAKELPSDFKTDFMEDIFKRYNDEVGEFIVQFRLSSFFSEAWLGTIYKGEKVKTWAGEAYSEEVHIYIKDPIGIDKEAFDYFEGHPLWKKEELLEKYPTSTYSGWALFSMSYIMNLDLQKQHKGKILLESKAKTSSSSSEKLMYETNIEKDIKFHKSRLELLEKYVSMNPDHFIADLFMYEIAYHYGYLEDRIKSLFWAKKALSINKESKAAAKAQRLIEYIEKEIKPNNAAQIKQNEYVK